MKFILVFLIVEAVLWLGKFLFGRSMYTSDKDNNITRY